MKKLRKILSAIVLTAMVAFAAGCTPEDDPSNGGNNNGGTDTDSENMVDVGDLTTEVESSLWFDDYGTACFDASREQPMVHFSCRVDWNSIGKTIDLSRSLNGMEYSFRYEAYAANEEDMVMFTQYNFDGSIYSDLNYDEGTAAPVFTRGTLKTTHTEEGYSLLIEGVLTDGTDVLIKLKVAYTDEVVFLTENSMIYDGVKYDFSTNVTCSSNSLVQWTCSGSNGVVASGSMYEYYNGVGVFLQEFPMGDGFYFTFAFNVPGLQLTYNWNNDVLISTLNGETVSNPFSDGEASMYANNGEMSFSAHGTLTNGKEVKIWAHGNYVH